MTEEEFDLMMEIPKDATNIEVGKKLEDVFYRLFSSKAKAIICKILPNENKIYIKPFTWLKLKKVTDKNYEKTTKKIKGKYYLEKYLSYGKLRIRVRTENGQFAKHILVMR